VSSAVAKYDARDWVFEIEVPAVGTTPATWTEIGGINSWELDPSANSETTDDTTFRSAGQYEGHVAQRGGSIALEGFYEVDDANDTVRDPGQARVDALAELVGRASLGRFRFRHDAQTSWTVWGRAYVEPGSQGGGNNDNTSWAATVTRSGAATTVAVA
jgi:hypothetical protein